MNMWNRTSPNDGDLLDLIDEWIAVASTQKTLLVDNPAKLYTGSATP